MGSTHSRGADRARLLAQHGPGLAEGGAVGRHPQHREVRRRHCRTMATSCLAALPQLGAAQLGGRGGRPVDDVGDAEAEGEQLAPARAGASSRGVKPERCRAGQNRLPGRAKWWPAQAV